MPFLKSREIIIFSLSLTALILLFFHRSDLKNEFFHNHSGKLINCTITSPYIKYSKGELLHLHTGTKILRKEIMNYVKLFYFDTDLNLFENEKYKGTKEYFSIIPESDIETLPKPNINFDREEFNRLVKNFNLTKCAIKNQTI